MAQFRVGQKVVCVKQHPDNILNVGGEYIISGIKGCEGCDVTLFDIGLCLPPDSVGMECSDCGISIQSSDRIWWIKSDRFRPLEYNTAQNEVVEKFKAPDEKVDVPEKELV